PDTFVTGVSPYPPIFFLLVAPFTLLPPKIALILWSVINLGLGAWVSMRLVAGTPVRRTQLVIAALLAFPVMEGFVLGQPIGFLMLSMFLCWRSLVEKRELRAGVWAGLLLLKPQYIVLLAFIMLIKRRWAFMRGFIAVGACLGIGSLALLGFSGTLSYVDLLRNISSNTSTIAGIHPGDMLSFNAMVLNFLPGLTAAATGFVTIALDLAAVAFVVWMWHGRWQDDPEILTHRVLVTMIATLLISHHNYVHGAALLVIPCLAIRLYRPWSVWMRVTLFASLVLPPVLFLMSFAYHWDWWIPVSQSVLVLMLAAAAVSFLEGRLAIQCAATRYPYRFLKVPLSLLNR
ncbi:MAG TPA: glycosyltransferase family 87 protein, partial [Nitrolancea sp.]